MNQSTTLAFQSLANQIRGVSNMAHSIACLQMKDLKDYSNQIYKGITYCPSV